MSHSLSPAQARAARAARRPLAPAALAWACALLAGCALGPDFRRPEPPAGERVVALDPALPLAADGKEQRFAREADLPADWWTRFESRELDDLVARALAGSPGLRSAQATLRQSEDNLRAGYGVFFPQIGAGLAASRQVTVTNLPPPLGHGLTAIGPYDLGTLSGNASYAIDLFGAQRRTVEALGAAADVQRHNLRATYLGLTANVVNAGIALAGYRGQADATRAMVRLLDDQIRVAQTQYQVGTGPYTAILTLQAQRSADAAALAALEQHLDQDEHLLAQLCGQPPAAFTAPAAVLEAIALPAELPDALPSDLARHRPDILAAEAALHEASAQIGVATADLFPSLTLGGTLGASNSMISQVLRNGTRFWSAQASLAASLFNGGSQWYTRKAAIDAYDASLAQYESVVLSALEQVADVMTGLSHDAQALRAQADALASATDNLKLTRAQYEAGLAGYLDMLAADTQFQQARLGYLGAVTQRLQDTVALFAALGGGWWNEGQPAPSAARPASAASESAPAGN